MKKCDPTYTDTMDKFVLLVVGTILGQYFESENKTALLLRLLRKLVRGCLDLAIIEKEEDEKRAWEEKINSLITLAKAVEENYESTTTNDWLVGKEASKFMFDAYVNFLQWGRGKSIEEIQHMLIGEEK